MVLSYFPEIFVHYWRRKPSIPFFIDKSVFNSVIPLIRAPTVNISRPLVTLKKPIKHVFIIVLESIRADALPLNQSFAESVQDSFTRNTTAATVTPLLNSLWRNSVRTVASTTSSYTLKSLLSTFCGIYPLTTNFLSETSPENLLYEKCLPELIHETFRTTNNRSAFRSALFTAARDNWGGQQALHNSCRFDTVISANDIYQQVGELPDSGWFGPDDSNILPLMWKWIDKNLAEEETRQLMMGLLLTGTHYPFEIPHDEIRDGYRHYIDNTYVNAYLNAFHVCDRLLKKIINGFKSRKLFNETLFVIVSDHGHAFYDNGKNTFGSYSVPVESTILVPLIFYNPYLEAKQLYGQFTNMDILPTIMDILLSSRSSQKLTNQLLSVPHDQLQSILSRYEGTSILRMPLEQQPVRYIFHLPNPGNSLIIVKQYPKKLTYDIANDEVHLYHLKYDPFELTDLIALDYDTEAIHPLWINVMRGTKSTRTWKGRWINDDSSSTHHHQILAYNKTFVLNSRLITMNNSKVQLKNMLDWADQTLELARLWVDLIKWRYRLGNQIVDEYKDKTLKS
jgi:hypothetical protein